MTITTGLLQRTFLIKYGDGTGTAFVLDRDDRQYLVTARHVVRGVTTGESISVFHGGQWKQIPIKVVGIGVGAPDIAVLAAPVQLAPAESLEASSDGLAYAQDVHFLGFPFGWDGGGEDVNLDHPLPFIKAGIVSSIKHTDATRIYIDAHGNPGFSGGPVAFAKENDPQKVIRIAGVVAESPRPNLRSVVDRSGKRLVDEDGEPIAYFAENQGFVIAFGINHATDLINKNPTGFTLPTVVQQRANGHKDEAGSGEM